MVLASRTLELRRPCRAALVLGMVLASATPAYAATGAERIAGSLERDPVYVHPRAEPTVSPAEAGRIRLRIVDRNIGRVKIAVLPRRSADRAGGVARLAHAIDNAAGGFRGTLIVSAGDAIYAVTSYANSQGAVEALRAAVARHDEGPLARQLLTAVDRLVDVDPGPGGDLNRPSPAQPPVPQPMVAQPGEDPITNAVEDFFDVLTYAVIAIVALPLLILALVLARRSIRRRRRLRRTLAEGLDAARAELIALGDGIRELDLDVQIPGAEPNGVRAYERAVSLYDWANTELSDREEASPSEVERVRAAIGEGRQAIERARALLARAAQA